MSTSTRRGFLHAGLIGTMLAPFASARAEVKPCVMDLTGLHLETEDSPFFEHYHSVYLPVAAIINPPDEGIELETSEFDKASYNEEDFKKLNRPELISHTHKFTITKAQLEQIGRAQVQRLGAATIERISTELTLDSKTQVDPFIAVVEAIEIRIFSETTGNYVHNIKIAPYQSTLAKVRNKMGKS